MRSSLNLTPIPQKRRRFKLGPEEYAVVWKHVLERDAWRCQECGSINNLQVHHIQRRSQLGGDVMANLITLCVECHRKSHVERR
jgi:5-methylcytosine-specific restriction endonuclease McrA